MTVQGAPGNRCKVLKRNLKGRGWTSINMQISDDRYVEKVFENILQKLRLSFYELDHCIDLGIVHVNNDESISSSWASLQCELGLRAGTPTSTSSRRCSTSLKDCSSNNHSRF